MLARLDVLPFVDIRISADYNENNRQLNAYLEFESLQSIYGEFKFNVVLVEDSIVWSQAGSGGGPNYVHDWLVREMINGAEGDLIYNGVWDPHQTFTDSISHTITTPISPTPDIRPEFCYLVVFVYKSETPFHSNAEIQQAVKIPLVKPEFKADISSVVSDVLQSKNSPYNYEVLITNSGRLSDTYLINFDFEGKSGWIITFATQNGVFTAGDSDTLMLHSNEQHTIQVYIDPNNMDGFGQASIKLNSQNQMTTLDSIKLRFVTNQVENLIIDDDGDLDYQKYSKAIFDSLAIDYGILKSSIFNNNSFSDFDNFKFMVWQTGTTRPGLNINEMDFISYYLDQGGNLYLNGVDLAYQLADSTSAFFSQNSLDFFNNYLHASYIKRDPIYTVGQGIAGDTISQNIIRMWLYGGSGANIIRGNSGKYANQIEIADSTAVPMFSFYFVPNELIGIRSSHLGQDHSGNVFFTTFGLETVAELTNRYIILNNMTKFLDITTGITPGINPVIRDFKLHNNYPNPFNTITTITFDLNKKGHTRLFIFNILGEKIKTLINTELESGNYLLKWDATNNSNRDVSSGIYYYQLVHKQSQSTNKMLLLR